MRRRSYPTRNQLQLPGIQEAFGVTEWELVQRVLESSIENEPAAWEAFARCKAIEIYADGSAPLRNPGGPAGFAAVVVGFAEALDHSKPERPNPRARYELAGYIPERTEEPRTSNNRAEIAAVLAALEALRHLERRSWVTGHVHIW